MGLVYRAWHDRLQRAVAIKVIAPELAAESTFRARFEQESLLAAQIEHPNVIPVYEVGESARLLFIVMRYIEGVDVGELLHRSGRLDPRRAASMVNQVAAALDGAHARGLVHRDVKPGNLLVSGGIGAEHIYLTDFGITKRIADGGGLTATGLIVGTVDYVAPEQVLGRPVDARSDVYALGCVLYELLTGLVPFPRDTDVAKLFAHVNDAPPAPRQLAPAVPRELDAVVTKAMAKNPDERYLSAGDLGRAAIAGAEGRPYAEPPRSVATGRAATQNAEGEPAAEPRETAPAAPDEPDTAIAEATTKTPDDRHVSAGDLGAAAIASSDLKRRDNGGLGHPPPPPGGPELHAAEPGTPAESISGRKAVSSTDWSDTVTAGTSSARESVRLAGPTAVHVGGAVAISGAIAVIASAVIASLTRGAPNQHYVGYWLPVAVMSAGVIVLIGYGLRSNRRAPLIGGTALALALLGVTFPLSWHAPHTSFKFPDTAHFWLGVCGAALAALGAALASWQMYAEPSGRPGEPSPTWSRATRVLLIMPGPLIVIVSLRLLNEWSGGGKAAQPAWKNATDGHRYPLAMILLCAFVVALAAAGIRFNRRRLLVIAAGVACLVLGESVPLIFTGAPHWGPGRWLAIAGAVLAVAGLALAAARTGDAVPQRPREGDQARR